MFVDTNVLVEAKVIEAPNHEVAKAALDRAQAGGESISISRQVLREYLATLTRPQTWLMPVSLEEVLGDVDRMERAFLVLEDGPRITVTLLALCRVIRVGGRQIHDANIVATMLAHGEHRLLTFNSTDFIRYGDQIELVGGQP